MGYVVPVGNLLWPRRIRLTYYSTRTLLLLQVVLLHH